MGSQSRPETEGGIDLGDDDASTYEWTDEHAATYLLRPKRPVSGRNQPGQMITATRGSIANFKGYKNGNGPQKGKGGNAATCIRCAATDRHWKQCPFPFQAKITIKGKGKPAFSKGKGKPAKCSYQTWQSNDRGWKEEYCPASPPDDQPLTQWTEREHPSIHLPAMHTISEHDNYVPSSSPGDDWNEHYMNYGALPLYPVFTQDIWKADHPISDSDLTHASCPILIDSGASFTVVGKHWMDAWDHGWQTKLTKSTRMFRFGAGKYAPVWGL